MLALTQKSLFLHNVCSKMNHQHENCVYKIVYTLFTWLESCRRVCLREKKESEEYLVDVDVKCGVSPRRPYIFLYIIPVWRDVAMKNIGLQ